MPFLVWIADNCRCDISDALLKLGHPSGGFLPDITMWSPRRQEGDTKVIGPAYTVKFVRNIHVNAPKLEPPYVSGYPEDRKEVDCAGELLT